MVKNNHNMLFISDRCLHAKNKTQCIDKFEGELIQDHTKCPCLYYCQSCSNNNTCVAECNKTNRVQILSDENECKTNCECKCATVNCTKYCHGNAFKVNINNFGCKECECFCPKLHCDDHCGGQSLRIVGSKDKAGCSTKCSGCRTANSK